MAYDDVLSGGSGSCDALSGVYERFCYSPANGPAEETDDLEYVLGAVGAGVAAKKILPKVLSGVGKALRRVFCKKPADDAIAKFASKSEAREALVSLPLTAAQRAGANRAIARATRKETISVMTQGSSVVVLLSAPDSTADK